MKYASVIVTFNRKIKLKQAIESLLEQSCPVTKVVVIDNASTDGTDTLMKIYQHDERIVYNRLPSNMGGSMGFYVGIKEALKLDVDWISLSDDDAIYSMDYFEKTFAIAKLESSVKCFTGTVKSEDGTIQHMHRRVLSNKKTLQESNCSDKSYSHNFYIDGFTFVGVVLKKNLISEIGLPEKDFFIWKDDDEYSLRVRRLTRVLNISDATIVHLNGVPNSQFKPDWKEYYGIRNRLIIEKKYSTATYALLLSNCKFIIKRLLAIVLKPSHYPYVRYLIRQIYDGYSDGIKGKMGINDRYLP